MSKNVTDFFSARAGRDCQRASLRCGFDGVGRPGKENAFLRDGVKVNLPNGWFLVRGSNTEPIIRLIAEAQRESGTAELTRLMQVDGHNGAMLAYDITFEGHPARLKLLVQSAQEP